MLHNTTRETLLQSNSGYTALLIDALYFLGLETYTTFTVEQAINLLCPLGLNPRIVRIGLKHPLFKKFGQRSAIYTLPAISTCRKLLNIADDDPTSDDLPRSAFSSLKEYRKALLFALIARRPGLHYREWLAEQLGVVGGTIYNYCEQLGIIRYKNYVWHELSREWWAKLPSRPYSGRFCLTIHTKNKVFETPLNYEIAKEWIKRKAKVLIREQIESRYALPELPY